MEEFFNHIVSSFQALWKMKNYGSTIEVITPMVTANDNFVSVFITRRGNDYVVTDGGWIEAGMYECEPGALTVTFHRVFRYYTNQYNVDTTETQGKKFYFKKIANLEMLPSLVFDMSNFISCVVNTAFIPLMADRDSNTFKKKAHAFLNKSFGNESFEYDRPLTPDLNIKFSAIKREGENMKVINFVSGANATNYANTLCRSNTNFDMIEANRKDLHISKTITLLDDSRKQVIDSNLVRPYYNYLMGKCTDDNKVILWNGRSELCDIV